MFDIFGRERQTDSSPCVVNVWIGLSLINQLANEIGLLAHVISKLKMADEDRQSDKMALTALLVVLLVRKIRRRRSRRRKTWAREWILRSQQQGAYPNLLRELNAEDHDAFRQFHPLDRDSFKTVLVMVAPFVTKQDTNMISPAWFHSAK